MIMVMMAVVVVPVRTDAANMVVMANLGLTDITFIADDLLAVLAQLTVHDVFTA